MFITQYKDNIYFMYGGQTGDKNEQKKSQSKENKHFLIGLNRCCKKLIFFLLIGFSLAFVIC